MKKWKIHIDWKKVVVIVLICAGLIFLTQSFLMSAGILLVLIVIDQLIENWQYRRHTHKIFEDLRNDYAKKQNDKSK